MRSVYALSLLALSASTMAKTDMDGCTYTDTVSWGGAYRLWYVDGTGEICEFLDCGGGRAPPKTTVPGCGHYSGTATYTPRYMPGWGPDGFTGSTPAASVHTSASRSAGTGASSSQPPVTTPAIGSSSSSASTSGSDLPSTIATITTPPIGLPTGNTTVGTNSTSSLSAVASPGAAVPVAVAGTGFLAAAAGLIAGLAML